ncbi:MAG: hypothetical protein CL609_05890 [Anaerolineaceae bacterium]|nr:hypothetical protein [Anaerolineaceae bacterium]
MLHTYQEFLTKIKEVGVLSFYAQFLNGFPKLQDETMDSQWHTGNPETDPWIWKDQVTIDHKAAFGNILGGNKGFISEKMYPLFYAANRPEYSLEILYEDGKISKTVLDVYELFTDSKVLSTATIRRLLGKSAAGKAQIDSAIVLLQNNFFITICGNERKVSKAGKEYGWPANTYCKVEDWAGDWLADVHNLDKKEAQKQILIHCASIGKDLDLKKLAKLLFGKNL